MRHRSTKRTTAGWPNWPARSASRCTTCGSTPRLQASLDELRQRNLELRASRARIVAASDQSRRQIERNLHDGAQQHLVAMAVKIGLARRMLGSDPTTADAMLEELRSDVQDTLTELRELAHGIYPPLLRDRGLLEALQTAANRASLPTTVDADGTGRYAEGVETAVYFCCLEAMQNAGKHAGEGAELTVKVSVDASDGACPASVLLRPRRRRRLRPRDWCHRVMVS